MRLTRAEVIECSAYVLRNQLCVLLPFNLLLVPFWCTAAARSTPDLYEPLDDRRGG